MGDCVRVEGSRGMEERCWPGPKPNCDAVVWSPAGRSGLCMELLFVWNSEAIVFRASKKTPNIQAYQCLYIVHLSPVFRPTEGPGTVHHNMCPQQSKFILNFTKNILKIFQYVKFISSHFADIF